jgi:hypothetical protein
VVVSRGELIEIGDGFRIPDVLARSGARLVEIGTTNRTRAADYERAIGEQTAVVLRVHQSNFRVVGFEERPRLEEVAEVAQRHGLPLVDDLGSGHVSAGNRLLLGQEEPTARESLAAGRKAGCCWRKRPAGPRRPSAPMCQPGAAGSTARAAEYARSTSRRWALDLAGLTATEARRGRCRVGRRRRRAPPLAELPSRCARESLVGASRHAFDVDATTRKLTRPQPAGCDERASARGALGRWRAVARRARRCADVARRLADARARAGWAASAVTAGRSRRRDGIFAEEEPGVFRNTAASELLTVDGWDDFARLFGGTWLHAIAGLDASGEASFPRVLGQEFWSWFASHPDERAAFDRAMAQGWQGRLERLETVAWRGDETVVDVGGGNGSLLRAFLERHPGMRGIVLDLPETVRDEASFGERLSFVEGSFFESVPPGNAHVLSTIIHDWDNESAKRILTTVRASAGERLVLLESVIEPGNEPQGAKWLDLLMLVIARGRSGRRRNGMSSSPRRDGNRRASGRA